MRNVAGVPALVLALSLLAWSATAADISVPSLEVATRGSATSGLSTNGRLEMVVEGGIKLGGSIKLGVDGASLGQVVPASEIIDPAITPGPGGDAALSFLAAAIRLREVFGSGVSLEFFVGEHDTFATGDEFTELFGAPRISSRYSGFFTFDTKPFYEGLHKINGTGLSVDIPLGAAALLSTYLYQDARIMDTSGNVLPGHYSADIRALLNWEKLKLEAFIGATHPGAALGIYRAGLLFHAAEGLVEFFAQMGVPRWDAAGSPFDMSMFYLLFEPRVTFGAFSIVPTFFWRPAFYLQQSTGLADVFDVNLALLIGDEIENPISGGLETTLEFDLSPTASNLIEVEASPFVSFITPGVLWQIKPEFTLWPFDLANLFTLFVGVDAQF